MKLRLSKRANRHSRMEIYNNLSDNEKFKKGLMLFDKIVEILKMKRVNLIMLDNNCQSELNKNVALIKEGIASAVAK